eukprot:evm.model.scf_167.2 EVM.evm.TU.scf_167.2   scf_167:27778-36670(-)
MLKLKEAFGDNFLVRWEQMRLQELNNDVARLRQRLKASPDEVQAYIELGMALQEVNQLRPDGGRNIPEAEKAYKKALEFTLPAVAKTIILGNMGALLMSSGRIEEAIKCIDEAVRVSLKANPTSERKDLSSVAGLIFNKGKALSMIGQLEASESTFAQALDAARGFDTAVYAKAAAAMQRVPPQQLWELQCAADYLRRGLGENATGSEGPNSTWIQSGLLTWFWALMGYSTEGKRKCSAKEEWQWLDAMEDADRSWLYFALYKALQDSQLDIAWQYLEEGNRLQREGINYDPKVEQMGFQVMTQMFTASTFHPTWGFHDSTPIFVVGMPRSGSTLIEQLLASHSKVHALGEDTPLAPLVGELMAHMGKDGQPHVFRDYGATYVAKVHEMAVAGGNGGVARTVDKMLRNVWNLGYIHLMLPDSCIIHAARHPMDAGLSCYAQPFEGRGTPWAWNLTEIGHQQRLLENLMRHWSKVLPHKILKVRYEALVQDVEGEARRILEHCGLQWEDRVLRFYEADRAVQTASLAQVRQDIYTTSMGKWRKYEKYLQPLKVELGEHVQDYEKELRRYLTKRKPQDPQAEL